MMQSYPLFRLSALSLALGISVIPLKANAQDAKAPPECVQDPSVTQRFIPVELLTGNPIPENPELVFSPVKRVYPFLNASADRGDMQETSLDGPVSWTGEGGKVYEVYERKVPRANERFALTPDRTAIGRVYDERFGNATNEGKFPVGVWLQGQTRTYNTIYHSPRGHLALTSSVTIEKLSCAYEGVSGAIQYRWKTSRGLDYSYIYVPGRGLVQVNAFRRG